MSHNSLYRHPGFRALVKAVARENRWQLAVGCCLVGCGGAMVYYCFGQNGLAVILGLVLLLSGIRLGWHCLQHWHVVRHPLVELLYKDRQRVVWMYGVVTERMPFGWQLLRSGILYFKLDNGEDYSVAVPFSQLRLVTKTMSRLLPHASVGYTKEREARFQANPLLLLRDAADDRGSRETLD